jgi:hypothetical protein
VAAALTYEELVAKAMPADGELIEFDGQNCNDYDEDANCGGWDGVSNRCQCGNRRVYWSQFRDAVYAVAD